MTCNAESRADRSGRLPQHLAHASPKLRFISVAARRSIASHQVTYRGSFSVNLSWRHGTAAKGCERVHGNFGGPTQKVLGYSQDCFRRQRETPSCCRRSGSKEAPLLNARNQEQSEVRAVAIGAVADIANAPWVFNSACYQSADQKDRNVGLDKSSTSFPVG